MSQIVAARKKVIRFIHQHRLTKDNRLPVDNDLRTLLGIPDPVYRKAMLSLVEYGVLYRKRRLGTVVADPDACVPDTWTIAVTQHTMQQMSNLPVEHLLKEWIRSHLAIRGCIDRSYVSPMNSSQMPTTNRIGCFTKLMEDLQAQRVDGVMTTHYFVQSREYPVCYLGAWQDAEFGVIIDYAAFVRMACRLLIQKGCDQLALMTGHRGSSGAQHVRSAFESITTALSVGHPWVEPERSSATAPCGFVNKT